MLASMASNETPSDSPDECELETGDPFPPSTFPTPPNLRTTGATGQSSPRSIPTGRLARPTAHSSPLGTRPKTTARNPPGDLHPSAGNLYGRRRVFRKRRSRSPISLLGRYPRLVDYDSDGKCLVVNIMSLYVFQNIN